MSTLSVDILGVEECKLLVYYVGMKDEKIVFYSALGFFQLVYIIIHVLVFLFVATFIPAISGYFKWLLGLFLLSRRFLRLLTVIHFFLGLYIVQRLFGRA